MRLGNFNETGGRQIHQDDLAILQDQVFKAIQDQYKGQGAFILNGCTVAGAPGSYSISAGLVYIDGVIMQLDAVTGIATLPKYIHQATPLNQDSFTLELGGTAYKRTLYKAELVSSIPGSGEYISVTSSGGRTYNDILANSFLRLSGNQTVNGTKTFTSTIAGSINGNASTAVSATTALNSTNAVNATNAGNANTVNNGVYTNTNNTLSGNNTFTGVIIPTGGIKTDDGRILHKRIVDLGDWNMDTTNSITVTISNLDVTKIRDINIGDRSDTDAFFPSAFYKAPFTDLSNNLQLGYSVISQSGGNAIITITRTIGGSFDSTDFNQTSYNRGWINVDFES